MDIIKYSLHKPVTITVAVILILIFGLLALQQLPLQLTPHVSEAKYPFSQPGLVHRLVKSNKTSLKSKN